MSYCYSASVDELNKYITCLSIKNQTVSWCSIHVGPICGINSLHSLRFHTQFSLRQFLAILKLFFTLMRNDCEYKAMVLGRAVTEGVVSSAVGYNTYRGANRVACSFIDRALELILGATSWKPLNSRGRFNTRDV
jgi:hypothetical protein